MLFENKLFRKKALAHKGQTEPLNHLLRVTAPHEWVIVWGLAVVLAGIVAWAVFGSIEQKVSADCILTVPGERHAVVALDTGVVTDILVHPGDWVESGQAIANVRSTELVRRERLARTQLALLENLPESTLRSRGSDMDAARAELHTSQALLAAGESVASSRAGQIVSLSLVPGQAVTEGTAIAWVRTGDERHLEALSFVSSDWAKAIEPGSLAHIVLPTSQYGDTVLDAEVSVVSHRRERVPHWLSESILKSASPGNHLVRVIPRELRELSVADGTHCRVWFTRPPVSLLRMLMPGHASGPG